MCFSTARDVTCSDEAIAELDAPVAIRPSTSRSRLVSRATGLASNRSRCRISASTTCGSMTLSPRRTASSAEHEVLDVGDVLLEQVAAPGAAAGHQGECPLGVGVLGQHHDPQLRVRAAEALGGADALVGVRGRHPDVGQHHVGVVLGDGPPAAPRGHRTR